MVLRVGERLLLLVAALCLGACATVRLRSASGEIETKDPFTVLSYAPDGRWVTLCQAREDTDGNGRTAVFFGTDGPPSGDRLRPYFIQGSGPGTLIDDWLGSDPSGRYVAYVRQGRAWIQDTRSGHVLDLSARGAIAPPLWSFRGVPTARFSADGAHVLYFRRLEGKSRTVVRDLATGGEQLLPQEDALVGDAEFAGRDRWIHEWVLPTTTARSDRKDLPTAGTDISSDPCGGITSAASLGKAVLPAVDLWRSLQSGAVIDSPVLGFSEDQALVLRGGALVGIDPAGVEHERAPASCGPKLLFAREDTDALLISCSAKSGRLLLLQGNKVVDPHLTVPYPPVETGRANHPRLLTALAVSSRSTSKDGVPSARTQMVLIDLRGPTLNLVPSFTLLAQGRRFALIATDDGTKLLDMDSGATKRVSDLRFEFVRSTPPWALTGGLDLVNLDTGVRGSLPRRVVHGLDEMGRVLVSAPPGPASAPRGPLHWEQFRSN